jgi:hypothetical protein
MGVSQYKGATSGGGGGSGTVVKDTTTFSKTDVNQVFTHNHGLNTSAIEVAIYDPSSQEATPLITITDANNISVDLTGFTNGTYTSVVFG